MKTGKEIESNIKEFLRIKRIKKMHKQKRVNPEVTGIVLAGGNSSRLPPDKSQTVLGGKSLIQHVLNALQPCTNEILVVGADSKLECLKSKVPLRYAADIYKDEGPLIGLYSGLLSTVTGYNLVVGCDMPFLNSKLLQYIIDISYGWDATVPVVDGYFEPLCAVYSRSCISKIREVINRSVKRMKGFFDEVNLQSVPSHKLKRFDPELVSFFNVNTPEDIKKAELLYKKGYLITS